MFAFRGDTVLDPFMGSGTTSLAAKILERNLVGYEINPEFIEIAKQKLNTRQPDFMGTEYEFLHDTVKGDIVAAIQQLPYQFKDPHKLDKKTDPRKLTFGSMIEKESDAEREEFFIVKEILIPEKVRLSNGLTVKLIGIKSEPFTHDKAAGYLTEKIKREHSSEMCILRTSEYPTNYSCRIVPDDDRSGGSVQFSMINRSGTLVNALSPVTRTALTA